MSPRCTCRVVGQLCAPSVLTPDWNHTQVSRISVCGKVRADRKSTRLNSSHANISYAVFCLKKTRCQDEPNWTLMLPVPKARLDCTFHNDLQRKASACVGRAVPSMNWRCRRYGKPDRKSTRL